MTPTPPSNEALSASNLRLLEATLNRMATDLEYVRAKLADSADGHAIADDLRRIRWDADEAIRRATRRRRPQ